MTPHSVSLPFNRDGLRIATCRRLPTARVALAIFVVLSATSGCRTMSLEEARKITASFSGNVLVPPPRSADDIVALVEGSTQLSAGIRQTLQTSDEAPPGTLAGRELGRFYLQRGWAARRLGRGPQAVENFTRAVALLQPGVEQYSDSGIMARWGLAGALAATGDYRAAVRGYEDTILLALQPSQRGWLFVLYGDLVELLRVGEFARAETRLASVVGTLQTRFGAPHPVSAEARGLWAMARLRRGDVSGAGELATAAEILSRAPLLLEEDSATDAVRDERVKAVLAAYAESMLGAQDAAGAAAAFRVADVIRSRSVQRAIDAVAARGLATSRDLATLVREEQDARKQIVALQGLLAAGLGAGTPGAAAEDLRDKIDSLRRARHVIERRIADGFPAYAGLMHAPPATTEQAQGALRPDEALIATLVTEDTTYVWALPRRGRLAFAAVRIGEQALEEKVTRLRRALDPRVRALREIPSFDAATAHELYRLLLEPVRSGWDGADSLLVVAHGPLGLLPFGVLVTGAVELGAEREPLFANYRRVTWLARRHAVTTLPSVSALVTLRRLPAGRSDRRPFLGFGDPHFTAGQARGAERDTAGTSVATRTASPMPGTDAAGDTVALALRDVLVSPDAEAKESGLAMLPRLPDTAEEIRSIARVTGADLGRDVFLGAAANEQAVKTLDLANYRVVAFATHGLVPGDLDGLTQPALALSAPEVAKIEGDGLLTMEEILGLRLDADWVVLSACNTANGAGTGAEAISGLGRAFFYAGARALLVTHWPVETTSARALTTELFRRHAGQRGLSRAKALQQTMTAMIDEGGLIDPKTARMVFSYAHPLFWAPFALVGDGG